MCRNPVCFSVHTLRSGLFPKVPLNWIQTQYTVLYSIMYFYFNIICWIHCVLFSIFSSDTPFAKDFLPSLMCWYHSARGRKTTVVRRMCSPHPPLGCKVKRPPSGSSEWMLRLAPETPPPSHCRNWHEARGCLLEPGVVLFISKRKWPFWKNGTQRPLSKGLSAFTPLLLCHFAPSQG